MSINIGESFQKMPLGEKIIGGAAFVFFIDTFLPWFKYDLGPFGGSVNKSGWSGDGAIFTILALLISLAMLAQIGLSRFTAMQMPALPQGFTWARVHLGGAVVILLLVLLRLLLGESTAGFDADKAFGLWIGLVLAIAMVVGGGLLYQAERGGTAGTSGGGTTTSSM